MKLPHFNKKYVAGAAAAGLAMGAGGFAAAYFTATGTGTGHASVGHATPFTLTQKPLTGDLYPGTFQTVDFTINNAGQGIQHWAINTTQVTVATTDGNIITANQVAAATGTTVGKGVAGCKASWFSPSVPASLGGNLGPGGHSTFSVTVSMTNGTTGTNGTNQDPCETTSPLLTVAFSGPVPGFALYALPGSTATWANPGKANEAAVLNLGTGDGAGIDLLKPPSALPATAPTFTTSTYAGGSPRWDIFFKTGSYIFGTPSQGGNLWSDSHGAFSDVAWATVLTAETGKQVKAVGIVSTTGQAPNTTDTITNLHYGSQSF